MSSYPSSCSRAYASSDTAASSLAGPLTTCCTGTLSRSISCSISSSGYNSLQSKFARRPSSPGVTGQHGQQCGGSSHPTCVVGSEILSLAGVSKGQPQAHHRMGTLNRMMERSRKDCWEALESLAQMLQRNVRLDPEKIICQDPTLMTHRSNRTSDLSFSFRASVPPLARAGHICEYQHLYQLMNYSRIALILCYSEYRRHQRDSCQRKSIREKAPQFCGLLLEAIGKIFRLPFRTFTWVKGHDGLESMASAKV